MVILGVTIIFFFALNQGTFAQEQRQCIPNQICAMPHDYLKYGYNDNFTRIITFGDFIDQSTIKVTNMGYDGKSTTIDNYILNLKNGTLTDSNGTHSVFFAMIPIPVDPEKIDSLFADESINFNGFTRDTFGMHLHTFSNTVNSNIDKETGIKLNYDASISIPSSGNNLRAAFWLKLLDTNMITSSSDMQQSTIPEFGSLAGMITLISVIGIVVASRFRFHLLES